MGPPKKYDPELPLITDPMDELVTNSELQTEYLKTISIWTRLGWIVILVLLAVEKCR